MKAGEGNPPVARERLPIVLKQGTYCDNVTALHIVNKTLEFYELMLRLLRTERPHVRKGIIREALLAMPDDLSWKCDEHKIARLVTFRYSRESQFKGPCDACKEFIIAAFRDLSPMKNPRANQVFKSLCPICMVEKPMQLLYARKIIRKPGGGGVIILHVSSVSEFESMVRFAGDGDLKHVCDIREGALLI
jgi:hypothetical protein